MYIYKEIVGVIWLIFLVVWAISALGAKKNVRGNYWKFYGFRVALVIIALFAAHGRVKLTMGATDPHLGVVGVALCALGIGFAFWARYHIGRNWGSPMSIKQDRDLITSGPYSYVRHPIYSGILLALIGTVIVQGTVWLFAFFVSLIYFIYSAVNEEKTLSQEFPVAYPEYKRQSKMLIPFVF